MKNINWKDVLIRSLKTFAETAFTFLVAEMAGMELFATDMPAWIGLILSAGAAGCAAVWNGVIEPVLKLPTNDTGEE